MSPEELQEKLDEAFPHGAAVTLTRKDVHFVTPRLMVLETWEDGRAHITCSPWDLDREMIFEASKVEQGDDRWVLHGAGEGESEVILTTNFEVKPGIDRQREKIYTDELINELRGYRNG